MTFRCACAVMLAVGCGDDGSSPSSVSDAGSAGETSSMGGAFTLPGGGGASGSGGSAGRPSTGGTGTGGTGTTAGGGTSMGGSTATCPAGEFECNGACLAPGASQGSCTVLLEANGIAAIAVDATDVYLIQGRAVGRVPKSGGEITSIVDTTDSGRDIAVNTTNVFWVEDTITSASVFAMPKSGGTPTMIASHSDDISALRANESRVFFFKEHFGGPSDVVSVTTDGQGELQYGTSDFSVDAILLDDPNVYWGDSPFNEPSFLWMSAQASVTTQQITTAETVYYPVLGGDAIFFYDSLGDQLLSVPKQGGTATQVARLPSFRFGDPYLFGDGSHVYWLSDDGIWRIGLDGQNPESFAVVESGSSIMAGRVAVDASGIYAVAGRFLLKLTP